MTPSRSEKIEVGNDYQKALITETENKSEYQDKKRVLHR